jgi:hypothetical protein
MRRADADDSKYEAPRPVVRTLGWLILGCLSVATILGLSKRGEPMVDDSRALFLPGGALMMLQSTLLEGRRAHPWVAIPANSLLAPGLFTCGLGLASFGLEHLDPARPWLLLAVPMFVLLGLVCLREAIRGDDALLIRDATDGWHRFWLRGLYWMIALFSPLGVLWALGVVRFD